MRQWQRLTITELNMSFNLSNRNLILFDKRQTYVFDIIVSAIGTFLHSIQSNRIRIAGMLLSFFTLTSDKNDFRLSYLNTYFFQSPILGKSFGKIENQEQKASSRYLCKCASSLSFDFIYKIRLKNMLIKLLLVLSIFYSVNNKQYFLDGT